MAKIIIPQNDTYRRFAHDIGQRTGAAVKEEQDYIVLEKSPELRLFANSFMRAFNLEGALDFLRNQALRTKWRSLLLYKEGSLKYFGEDEIVLIDEGPTTSSNFPLRFPSEADKRVAEEWAARLGYKSLTEYILTAIEAFNNMWAEQASFLEGIQLREKGKRLLRGGQAKQALYVSKAGSEFSPVQKPKR